MLHLDKEEIGHFSERDLMEVLGSGGWEAILPQSLTDRQLVCVSDQLRAMLWGEGSRGPDGQPNAAVAMALLLMAKPQLSELTEAYVFELEGKLEVLHDVMQLLSLVADREIVNRILARPDEDDVQSFFAGVEALVAKRNPQQPAAPSESKRPLRAEAPTSQTARTSKSSL